MRTIAQGRARVVGADSMVDVTAERASNARRAARVIEAARGTERGFLREPDDARLEEMLAEVGEVAAQLETDARGWATR